MFVTVGDRVRSFDFAKTWNFPDPNDTSDNPESTHKTGRDITGERACYVEGEIIGFDDLGGCKRYRIMVNRDVFQGEDSDRRVGQTVSPPVNGTRVMMGGVTDFVELVQEDNDV
tara:strand:+ start:118 stop:459 length:342 start_codon:yes stop_codon:yes gene_type:complete